jgi:hypothetical protein
VSPRRIVESRARAVVETRSRMAGWEMLFVAIDDHAPIGFTQMHADERMPVAVAFLRDAVAYYAPSGCITTTGTAPMQASAARPRCPRSSPVRKERLGASHEHRVRRHLLAKTLI